MHKIFIHLRLLVLGAARSISCRPNAMISRLAVLVKLSQVDGIKKAAIGMAPSLTKFVDNCVSPAGCSRTEVAPQLGSRFGSCDFSLTKRATGSDRRTFRIWLAFVEGGVRVVVAPVEPVVLESGHPVEAFALRWARDGAALEVPFAGCGGVEQNPWFWSYGRWTARLSACAAMGWQSPPRLGRCLRCWTSATALAFSSSFLFLVFVFFVPPSSLA